MPIHEHELKMIHITYIVPKNDEFHIEIVQVGIPNGKEIKKYWCG